MAYRLLARFDDRTIRSTLETGDNLLGSDPACEVYLPNSTVSRRHAQLTVSGAGVTLEDLGSTNGTLLRSRRVDRVELQPGDIFIVGRVVVLLEVIADEDLEVGIDVREGQAPAVLGRRPGSHESTQSFSPLDRFSLDHLPRILGLVAEGLDRDRIAQQVGHALDETLPVTAVEIVGTAGPRRGVLYATDRSGDDETAGSWLELGAEGIQVRTRFTREQAGLYYRPIVDAAARLVALAGRDEMPRRPVSSPEPPVVARSAERPQPATLEPDVERVYDQAERVSRGDVGILISGESGTGKEVLAKFVHAASPRAPHLFVAINCASLPRDLLEAELFGVEKGVATGVEARPGKFEVADQGTLFLDEIGDMAPETQAKILRVLQEKEVYRLGGHTPRPARARIVAATNRPIHKMIAEGSFRSDLYHRIATWEVELPPLRQRRGDIPNLAAHFLSEESQRFGIQVRGISRAALRQLRRHRWEGNIRQLKNEIARAVLFLEDGELLDTARLSLGIRGEDPADTGRSLATVLAAVERDEITAALSAAEGDTAEAARMLQISRPTLYRRIKTLGIELPSAARERA